MKQENINFSSSELLKKVKALNLDKNIIDFSNSRFFEPISFNGFFFPKEVSFYNCIFEEPVLFHDLIFSNIVDFRLCHFKQGIIFSNVRFNNALFCNQAVFSGTLEITNVFCKERVDFSNSIIEQTLSINRSRFCFDVLFCNAVFKKEIDIINCDFEGPFNISCDNEIENKTIGTFYCVGTDFRKQASFRNREFLGVTTFRNVGFGLAPLFANCKLPHDISTHNVKFFDVESETSEQNYHILNNLLEAANNDKKSDFFKMLELEAKHKIAEANGRDMISNFLWRTKKWIMAFLVGIQNLFNNSLFLIKQREYKYITRKIFKTNYRKFYSYSSLKNLVTTYLRKPKTLKDSKPFILN